MQSTKQLSREKFKNGNSKKIIQILQYRYYYRHITIIKIIISLLYIIMSREK